MRRDTAENWQIKNPILRKGEQGLETDTGIIKIGDGVTAFNSLSDDNIYFPESYVNSTFSNALKGTKTDTAMLLDDVSPVTHEMGVKVRGKNLFDKNNFNHLLAYIDDIGVIKRSNLDNMYRLPCKPNTTYTVSRIANSVTIMVGYYASFPTLGSTSIDNVRHTSLTNATSYTFTTVSGTNYIALRLSKDNKEAVENSVQLELGTTATAYTPYVPDLTAVKVNALGKNLITFPYTYAGHTYGVGDTYTHNGVTFTVNADRSITANGTAGEDATEAFFNFFDAYGTWLADSNNPITVTLSGCPSGGSSSTYVLVQRNHYYKDVGKGVTYTTNKNTGTYTIIIKSGTTVENLVFKPQLELGTTATEYEPYITPTEYTPTADGTVNGVTSLYPNTTLTTDTDGVLIDCEYNRDINKAFAELQQAIISLGGNV